MAGATRTAAPFSLVAVGLASLAFVLYLAPATRVLQLSLDAIEYVDVARHLAAGEGFLLGIKSFHFGGTEVVHDGLEQRSPLYPLVVAAILRSNLGLEAAQVLNALLAAACVALVCAIGTELFGRRTGTLAALLAAFSPIVLVNMIPPLTEALAVSLTLLASWLLVRDVDRPRSSAYALAGALIGLGYLTRPTGAPIALALVAGALVACRARTKMLRPLVALLASTTVVIAPITVHSLVTRGSASYSGQTYMYSVYSHHDVLEEIAPDLLPAPVDFIRANRDYVVAAILWNVRRYARELFLDSKELRLLLPAWPLALFALVRGRYPRAAWPLLLAAAANFLLAAFTWAAFERRYLLLSLLLLLPFAVDGLTRLGLDRVRLPRWPRVSLLQVAVSAIILSWVPAFQAEYGGTFGEAKETIGTRTYHGVTWTGAPEWVDDGDLPALMDWVTASTARSDILSHTSPQILTFFTERPTVSLPRTLEGDRLRRFLVDHRVAYVMLNSADGTRRRYQRELESFEGNATRMTVLGDYRIIDTSPLWR